MSDSMQSLIELRNTLIIQIKISLNKKSFGGKSWHFTLALKIGILHYEAVPDIASSSIRCSGHGAKQQSRIPMQKPITIFTLEYFIDLVSRKRFLILIPFCLSMLIGLSMFLRLPKVYEARTLILVEPQRVPGEYVRSLIPQDMSSRISTISQQILSRSNLEKVIERFQLFSGIEHEKMFVEDKLDALRKKISVQVSRASGGANAFSITFQGGAPEMVMEATNALTSVFIESNLQIREEQAMGTSDFLDAELDGMRSKLDQLESRLQNYRRLHMGELPEQLDSNHRLMETTRIQLEAKRERLRNERSRLTTVDNEIDRLKIDLERDRKAKSVLAVTAGSRESSDLQPLEQLREQLASLKGGYTDQHPDVTRLRKKIEEMTREAKSETSASNKESNAKAAALSPQSPLERSLSDRAHQRLEILSGINSLQDDISKNDRQIREYQQRIERTPKREEELLSLKRDYDNIQSSYKSLLNRKLEADMAVNMEKKKKGEQFRVLDYAKLPEKPVSPNPNKFFFMSLAAGLGLGFGIVLLLNYIDDSVRRADELDIAGIPVLATIPSLSSPRRQLCLKVKTAMTVCGVLTATGLTGAFAYLAV